MQAISFQPPVYTSPAFASVRPQLVKASVQAMPVCQFGGGKVATPSFFKRLSYVWAQIKFAFNNIIYKVKLTKDITTHNHEIGHALAQYTSGLKPLGITLNQTSTHGGMAGHVLNANHGDRTSVTDHIKGIWNDLAGAMFGDFKVLKNGNIQVTDSALHQMSSDFGKASDSLKIIGFKNKIIQKITEFSDKFMTLNPNRVNADKTGVLKKELDAVFAQYKPQSIEFLTYSPIKIAFQKLYQLKTAMGPEKLEQLRQGVLNKGGWMFGKNFRQLYEKVFTPAERQQFEQIYQEFEREFLALPEMQALNAKK